MKANAIICEYNPFHNGHKYQIDCIKNNSDNPIVAIMSGNFTQRGDVAILDKFSRAQYACNNGVDLVIELPTVYATSNAEVFAKAGVEIADSLGCVENLCFSAESDKPENLSVISDAFAKEEFNKIVKAEMDIGTYYPKAVKTAIEKLYSNEIAEVIDKPNNVLGIEYLKALKGTNISPMIIKRVGVDHDDNTAVGNITSASNIRNMIYFNNSFKEYIPSKLNVNNYGSIEKLEKIILYKLRSMSENDFANLPDVNEGLENRIINAVSNYNSLNEILEQIKTKRYTMARLRRIVIHALLNITKDLPQIDMPYIRVLAFNDKGQNLLSAIKNKGKLPLITNVSDGYKNLGDNAKKIFDVDLFASDIYSFATDKVEKAKGDFTRGIIKL